jgi:hypothetical protein
VSGAEATEIVAGTSAYHALQPVLQTLLSRNNQRTTMRRDEP